MNQLLLKFSLHVNDAFSGCYPEDQMDYISQ